MAIHALHQRPDLGPAEAISACHETLQTTRGAAISIAKIDLTHSVLSYAGLGNVEARVLQGETETRLVTYRGIVGVVMRRVAVAQINLEPGWLFVMHSDGVNARFVLNESLVTAVGGDCDRLAQRLLSDWGRAEDDATVIAATAATR